MVVFGMELLFAKIGLKQSMSLALNCLFTIGWCYSLIESISYSCVYYSDSVNSLSCCYCLTTCGVGSAVLFKLIWLSCKKFIINLFTLLFVLTALCEAMTWMFVGLTCWGLSLQIVNGDWDTSSVDLGSTLTWKLVFWVE